MGTLGILTQLTLKVRPCPEASAVVWAVFPSAETIGTALDSLNISDARPMAIELLNPSAARLLGEPLGLAPSSENWVLAIGLEDNRPSVLWQIERLKSELKQPSMAVRQGNEAEPVWSALIEFQALRPGNVTVTANLPSSAVARFANELVSDRWAVQAHAGSGIIRHILAEIELETLAVEMDKLRSLAVKAGGSLTVSRCPADWKARLKVWGDPRPDWILAERIKNAARSAGSAESRAVRRYNLNTIGSGGGQKDVRSATSFLAVECRRPGVHLHLHRRRGDEGKGSLFHAC